MKLTEAKLKQMILEALKNKSFQDFGFPTPAEKLKADLGDEMYGKIQSLDKDQADIVKQSFDPDYPRDIKRESLNDVLEPLGFVEISPGKFSSSKRVGKIFNHEEHGSTKYVVRLYFGYGKFKSENPEEYKKNPYCISYGLQVEKHTPFKYSTAGMKEESLLQKTEQIRMPKLFTIDMTDEQDREKAESLIVLKEKAAILKALEELT